MKDIREFEKEQSLERQIKGNHWEIYFKCTEGEFFKLQKKIWEMIR